MKFDMLRSIGADHFIDYTREDFSKTGSLYDLIPDVVTYRSIFDYKRVLSPAGTYVMLGGGSYSRGFQTMILGPLISKTGSRNMGLLMHRPNRPDLEFISELFNAGKVIPVIDRNYRLNEVAEALRYYGKDLARGKVVIKVF